MPRARADGVLQRLSFDLGEVSGALGDLGVLLPITTALILYNGFDATAVLLVFGLTYVATGLYYRLPMPVQPLKAMAAIAIAQGLSADVVSAAGLLMGLILLLLAATGGIRPLAALFPRPVVRGIQAAVGLLLLQTGLRLSFGAEIVHGGPARFLEVSGASIPAGVVVAGALAVVLLIGLRFRRLPVSLLVLAPAMAIGLAFGAGGQLGSGGWGPALPSVGLPRPSLFASALLLLVIPQLPLTLGNAVIASADTARGYFGERASRVSHRSLLVTKGLANVFAGVVGGMPVCHGSGGLTAHYTFGARTGGATVMLGAALVLLALTLGGGAAGVLALVPLPALGLLLGVVGVQHALLARDVRTVSEWAVVASVAGIALATGNVAAGFGAGVALQQALRLYQTGRLARLPRFGRGPALPPPSAELPAGTPP